MTHYDLHIHSALSPCGDEDMTPGNIANMAALKGLGLIALTDHNACGNARALMKTGEAAGLVVVPGLELTTAEEIHVVCLFPDIDSAEAFGTQVYAALPPFDNHPDIFGAQQLLDAEDEPAGTEPRLLISATDIGIYDVPARVAPYGGIAILAHIDRHSNGVLSTLGDIDPAMGYFLAEVTPQADAARYAARFPFLHFLCNSDAHRLENIAEPTHANCFDSVFSSAAQAVAFLRQICV